MAGNFGATDTPGRSNSHFAGVGPWNGDMTLGDYGVDVQSHTVWAVLDHNSRFAVVPEPSTLVCLVAAAVGWLAFCARKRRLVGPSCREGPLCKGVGSRGVAVTPPWNGKNVYAVVMPPFPDDMNLFLVRLILVF